jgi:hypothetical protein
MLSVVNQDTLLKSMYGNEGAILRRREHTPAKEYTPENP